MDQIDLFLANKGIFILTIILFFLGMYGMSVCENYLKKLICMNIMQVAVIFFYLALGEKTGATIPILDGRWSEISEYMNPLPHTLMLTAIVVSLGTSGVGLALLMRIKEKYGSMDESEIREAENREQEKMYKAPEKYGSEFITSIELEGRDEE